MKPITLEWIEKAEGDFATAEREWRARKNLNYDAVCFHCQQCVEKYLKARLQEAEIPFTKTHDLVLLLDLVKSVEPLWEPFRESFQRLTSYAVVYRYPGDSADKKDAREAIEICRKARRAIRKSLGLEE
jgi:HEPN domain-containing protein